MESDALEIHIDELHEISSLLRDDSSADSNSTARQQTQQRRREKRQRSQEKGYRSKNIMLPSDGEHSDDGTLLPTEGSTKTDKRRNHARELRAAERDSVASLRTELLGQGALPALPPGIVASGGRGLEMMCPRTTVLAAALQRLKEQCAEIDRLKRRLQMGASPMGLIIGPPGGTEDGNGPNTSAKSFSSWAFQHSSVPTFIVYWGGGELRIVTCNRSFAALVGLAAGLAPACEASTAATTSHVSFECANPSFSDGSPLTLNSTLHRDNHVTIEQVKCFAEAAAAKEKELVERGVWKGDGGAAIVCSVKRFRTTLGEDAGNGYNNFVPCLVSIKTNAQVTGGRPTAMCFSLAPRDIAPALREDRTRMNCVM